MERFYEILKLVFIRNQHNNKMTTAKKNECPEQKKGKQVTFSDFSQGHNPLPHQRAEGFPKYSKDPPSDLS